MTPKVNIVVTVLNALDLTQKALASVNAVNYDNKEIVVVDNNSKQDVRSFLVEEHSKGRIDTLIMNGENKGFGAACNQGASAVADAEYVCFFSNDIEGVDNNWLAPLVNLGENKDEAGMIGCRLIYRLDHPDSKKRGKIQHAGCTVSIGTYMKEANHVVNKHEHRYALPSSEKVTKPKRVEMVTAACFLIKKSLFDNIGAFDPIFGAGYCEDLDLCLRLRRAGYTHWYCPQSMLYHFEMIATTTTIGGAAYRKQRTRNQEIVDGRWLKFIKEGRHKYE